MISHQLIKILLSKTHQFISKLNFLEGNQLNSLLKFFDFLNRFALGSSYRLRILLVLISGLEEVAGCSMHLILGVNTGAIELLDLCHIIANPSW